MLAGSVGGFAGLIAATGFAALGFAWLCRGRGRLAALALFAILATGCTVLGARFVDPGRTATFALDRAEATWPGGTALQYLGGCTCSARACRAASRPGKRGWTGLPNGPC